jgi:hypothetical protein
VLLTSFLDNRGQFSDHTSFWLRGAQIHYLLIGIHVFVGKFKHTYQLLIIFQLGLALVLKLVLTVDRKVRVRNIVGLATVLLSQFMHIP